MEKGTGMLLIAGACVLVLLIGSIKNRILEISDLVHRAKNLYVLSLRLMICKFCYPTFSPGILF